MSDYLERHWILSILLTIILGAIGSAVWDWAKPITKKIRDGLFNVVTFGAKRARDNIYRTAAKGHRELPSLYGLTVLFALILGVNLVVHINLYLTIYSPATIDLIRGNCPIEATNHEECVRAYVKETLMPYLQVGSLFTLFATVVMFYHLLALAITNSLIVSYEQTLRIARPYISDVEFIEIEQHYALIGTKEEYDEIVADLDRIIESNLSAAEVE